MLSRASTGAAGAVGPAAQADRHRCGGASCSRRWPHFRPASSCGGPRAEARPRPSGSRPCSNASWSVEKAESLRRRDAVSRVNLAYREYLDDNVALADELLDWMPGRPPRVGMGLRPAGWATRSSRRFSGSSQGQDVWSVAFSPDGSLLASARARGASRARIQPAS